MCISGTSTGGGSSNSSRQSGGLFFDCSSENFTGIFVQAATGSGLPCSSWQSLIFVVPCSFRLREAAV